MMTSQPDDTTDGFSITSTHTLPTHLSATAEADRGHGGALTWS